LYIVRADHLPLVLPRTGETPLCTVIDRHGVCFSRESYARWRDAYDVVRSKLPAQEEFVQFHSELNTLYRDSLHRSPRETGIDTGARLEGIVRYLALRVEGCDHAESTRRALSYVAGVRERELCPPASPERSLPPLDQTLEFSVKLDRAIREQAQSGHTTHVDLEGEAVWLQAYATERATGVTPREARTAVLAKVRAIAGL
jgi:hypothetical protein